MSPRLAPLGSPGPVTPLELEGEGGFFVAGARGAGSQREGVNSNELVEKLIEEEEAATQPRRGRGHRPG